MTNAMTIETMETLLKATMKLIGHRLKTEMEYSIIGKDTTKDGHPRIRLFVDNALFEILNGDCPEMVEDIEELLELHHLKLEKIYPSIWHLYEDPDHIKELMTHAELTSGLMKAIESVEQFFEGTQLMYRLDESTLLDGSPLLRLYVDADLYDVLNYWDWLPSVHNRFFEILKEQGIFAEPYNQSIWHITEEQ